MEDVINLAYPHIGEQIFESIETSKLVQCLMVSEAWKTIAENVLFKRWRGNYIKACENGMTEIVRILLERLDRGDTELNTRDNFGQYHGSIRYEHANDKSQWGRTAFMLACEKGHADIVKLTLEYSVIKNINLNAFDKYGETGFFRAIENGQTDVVRLLLEHSAGMWNIDLKHRAIYGTTAFHKACMFGHTSVVKLLLGHSETEQFAFNAKDQRSNPRNAFLWACYEGHLDVVKAILDHSTSKNIDLNDRDNFGITGFSLACKEGHKDVVELLLKESVAKNIQLRTTSIHGDTPYKTAWDGGHDAVVQLLQNSRMVDIDRKRKRVYQYTQFPSLRSFEFS